MKFKDFSPYKLDWGVITAEGFNDKTNDVILIFNCDLRSKTNINNTIQYVVGRVCWGHLNFPENALIKLKFDIRNQGIIVSEFNKFKTTLEKRFAELSVRNNISIEFLS